MSPLVSPQKDFWGLHSFWLCHKENLLQPSESWPESWLWLVISMEFLQLFLRPHSTPKAVSGGTAKFQLFSKAYNLSLINLFITLPNMFFTRYGKDSLRKSLIAIFVFAETCLFWELFVKGGLIFLKWTSAYQGLTFNP